MNNTIYKTRVALIRIGKVLPFLICALLVVSYAESAFALATDDFVVYDDEIILNKPVSWLVGDYFEYNLQMLAVLCIISIAVETCIWNKLACAYLGINLYEKSFFETHVYDNEIYYAVICANIIIAAWITYKGLRILFER